MPASPAPTALTICKPFLPPRASVFTGRSISGRSISGRYIAWRTPTTAGRIDTWRRSAIIQPLRHNHIR